ncbi:superinfection immunity protein [Streptomyces huasconensis]|uniref:Superinfection immunity protein n=1 Tax=Streptomyces huasconensis TaxID=1854574 RepID=A0ABV3LR12_9ACTN
MFGIDWLDGPIAIAVGVLFLAFYLLPSLIAYNRDAPHRFLVLLINLFFGASVLGWLIALYLATRKAESPRPQSAAAPG